MNVYDFDDTIYHGDSTKDFCLFLLKRHPGLVRYLPRAGIVFLQFLRGQKDKTAFKESLFRIFSGVKNIDKEIILFWDEHLSRIKPFYQQIQREDDIIISASPDFLLRPCCEKLGINHLLASNVHPRNGRYLGVNCHGHEKVRRFLAAGFSLQNIEKFYSDSYSDSPLAQYADESFLVMGHSLRPWGTPKKPHKHERLRTLIQKIIG